MRLHLQSSHMRDLDQMPQFMCIECELLWRMKPPPSRRCLCGGELLEVPSDAQPLLLPDINRFD